MNQQPPRPVLMDVIIDMEDGSERTLKEVQAMIHPAGTCLLIEEGGVGTIIIPLSRIISASMLPSEKPRITLPQGTLPFIPSDPKGA